MFLYQEAAAIVLVFREDSRIPLFFWSSNEQYTRGLFGLVAIHWTVRDIHFFSCYRMFGSVCEMDMGNQMLWNILSKVVQAIRQNLPDEDSH
jgi:hypothetical protein